MEIIYNEKKRIFSLNTENLSYYLSITKENFLKHLYFGKFIPDIDDELVSDCGFDWSNTYFSKEGKVEKNFSDFYYYDKSFVEVSTHGLGDTRPSSFIINNEGNNKIDFRYESHKIYNGRPNLKDLPHFKVDETNAKTLEITLIDSFKNIYLILSFTLVDGLDVILRNSKIINKEKESVIEKAMSLTLDLPSDEYSLIHFSGDWSRERWMQKEELNYGLKKLYSKFGRSGHEENPFIILENNGVLQGFSKNYIGLSFVYSGNFAFEFFVNKYKSLRVNVGINDEDFSYRLNENEEFILPEALLIYSESLDELTHTSHDLIRNHLLNKNHKEIKSRILLNSWEACFMDFDNEKILKYIDEAKKINVGLFVLDDGWFSNRNDDSSSLGDWWINENKVHLKEIIDKCHSNDIKFGIWFEPEMINPDSKLFREHPDYIIGDLKNYDLTLSRHQFVLDFSRDDVIDNIFDQMCQILDNFDVDYIKWDHNRSIFDAYSSKYGYKESGKFYHDNIKGVYKLLDKLQNRYPQILFEGCASGGGRFDLGMLYYFPQIWCSDETDPVQRNFIQYSTSIFYPLTTIGSHISKNKITSYTTKSNIALFGTYGYEFDPVKLSAEEKEEVKKASNDFFKYHELIENGDLYHLKNPFTSNYCSLEVVSKNKKEALVIFNNFLKEGNTYRYLKLQGLDDNKFYKNSLNNKVLQGFLYKNVGINLTRWMDEFTSILIYLEEVEYENS